MPEDRSLDSIEIELKQKAEDYMLTTGFLVTIKDLPLAQQVVRIDKFVDDHPHIKAMELFEKWATQPEIKARILKFSETENPLPLQPSTWKK